MSGVSELPIISSAPDQLRYGINASAASAAAPPQAVHPVELIEQQYAKQQDANQKNLLARIYGSHMPMKLHMEQTVLSQFRRAPGLPSSNLGLSIVMGTDEDIDWSDVHARPENNEAQYEALSELEQRYEGQPKRRVF